MIDRRRRDGSDMAKDPGHFLEGSGEFGVARTFFYGEMRKRGDGFRGVVVKEQAAAILRWSEEARLRQDGVQIEFLELEVSSDVGAERAERV